MKQDKSPAPRPEHFDADAYKPNGERTGRVSGRRSPLSVEQAEQIEFMRKLVRVAEKALDNYLYALGYTTHSRQRDIVLRIRKGWRPRE